MANVGVFVHYSPSLPLSGDWFDHVDHFPVHEFGAAVEFPGPAVFKWRIEGNMVNFPEEGVLSEGLAYWGGVGVVAHYHVGDFLVLSFGPQFLIGRVQAQGTIEMMEPGERHLIDFDGDGTGAGIGMTGAVGIKVGENLRVGVQPSVVYFGVSQDDVPIIGRNADDPTVPHDTGIYRYKSEYIALSLRLFAGFEF
ncbi:MAG TPA: hypothetical protein ENN07_02355 [candidate division Zixibacteria bacterium]|nr:hypothetical protein [candidate division Zixibacteria bacterium]